MSAVAQGTISEEASAATADLLVRLAEMVSARAFSPRIKLLNKAQLADALGIGESTIDEMVSKGELPKPIPLGRRKGWRESTLIAWLDAKEGK
jgi:predicted DNA-binding transcriptional regulator AlpA